jgi:hypothetical protein
LPGAFAKISIRLSHAHSNSPRHSPHSANIRTRAIPAAGVCANAAAGAEKSRHRAGLV